MCSLTSSAARYHTLTLLYPVKRTVSVSSLRAGRGRRSLLLTSNCSRHPMAATENFSTVSSADPAIVIEDEIEKFGFKRAEMYESSLAGTMGDPYDRHVFICYKDSASWVARLEFSEADPLAKRLASAYMSRRGKMSVKTRITICEENTTRGLEEGDALIFPDMIKYKGLNESNVENFVEDVLLNAQPWTFGEQQALTGSHIFVCAHGSRDKRCGVCGPIIIDNLKQGIDSRGLNNEVFVSACSHIGGHKYAGNLIVFNPNELGKVIGHWYGYVTPEDIPEILDQHLGKGIVLPKLLRGQMGVYPEGGGKFKEEKPEKVVPVEMDSKKISNIEETLSNASNGTTSGCCQGVNGVSCCQNLSSEASVKTEKESPDVEGKKTKCLGAKWFGPWEHGHAFAAVALAGAVTVVALAHVLYRRSL